MHQSRPTVYVYVPSFVWIGLFCRSLTAKTLNFCRFWNSAFTDIDSWQQSEEVEHGCTTTNLPLSNGIKIVSVLQRLSGKIWRTSSDVQKRDGQTNRQTNKKLNVFGRPGRQRVKSEHHQTRHGDRGPRARSCTSKTFGGLTHRFAASRH